MFLPQTSSSCRIAVSDYCTIIRFLVYSVIFSQFFTSYCIVLGRVHDSYIKKKFRIGTSVSVSGNDTCHLPSANEGTCNIHLWRYLLRRI